MCLRREGHDRRRAGSGSAQRSCRLAGLLPRVRRTCIRDSSQTDGQLSHQAEAASGVAGAPSRCRRGGRQTPGWTTCDSAARRPTSSVPPAIRHVLGRGNGTSKRPARTPSGEANVRKDTERSAAAERSRHSRRLELPRFRRHLNASGRKPGKVRFRCPELGRRIPRSFAARRSVSPSSATSRSASWRRIWGSPT
jgi:hypothetical protein